MCNRFTHESAQCTAALCLLLLLFNKRAMLTQNTGTCCVMLHGGFFINTLCCLMFILIILDGLYWLYTAVWIYYNHSCGCRWIKPCREQYSSNAGELTITVHVSTPKSKKRDQWTTPSTGCDWNQLPRVVLLLPATGRLYNISRNVAAVSAKVTTTV